SRTSTSIRVQTRSYSDLEIVEFVQIDSGKKWSATILGNVLLASSSSFILEEAIRLHISEDQNSMASQLGERLEVNSPLGRLIVSAHGISRLLAGTSSNRENAMALELASRES